VSAVKKIQDFKMLGNGYSIIALQAFRTASHVSWPATR